MSGGFQVKGHLVEDCRRYTSHTDKSYANNGTVVDRVGFQR